MKISPNKTIVSRFNKEVIEGGHFELSPELFDPAFINHTIPAGFPKGPEGMRQFLENVLHKGFSKIRVEIHDQIEEGDRVCSRKTIHAVHSGNLPNMSATGKPVQFAVLDIIRLKDGKYFEHWGCNNILSVMQELTQG